MLENAYKWTTTSKIKVYKYGEYAFHLLLCSWEHTQVYFCLMPKLISNKTALLRKPFVCLRLQLRRGLPSRLLIVSRDSEWKSFLTVTKELQIHEMLLVCVCCDTQGGTEDYAYAVHYFLLSIWLI